MSTPISTPEPPPRPTHVLTFYAVDNGDLLTFEWGRRMPNNGHLGIVTFRQFKKKPIQVFDPEPVVTYGITLGWSWAYQAQDGSFLCRLFVSNFGNVFITFSQRKKGDWPLISLLAPHHPTLADAGSQTASVESNQVT
jgi:hypothetical protein